MALRRLAFAALGLCVVSAGCKRLGRANGDVGRNWAPPVQDTVMGVATSAVQSAIAQRLAAAPPPPVNADRWHHVRTLYRAFGNNLLWLTDKGVHQPRVATLLSTLANADSDALRLDAYPLAALARALDTITVGHPSAAALADADVLLSAAYASYGESMLAGQIDPSTVGQSWHINPRDDRVDSALVSSLRADTLAQSLVAMRPRDLGYDSLRLAFGQYREIVAHGGWGDVPAGKALQRGGADSPARLAALRARLLAEGYLADSSGSPANPRLYGRQLAAAVADFQARHDIAVDSTLGAETVQAMNVPASQRLAEIAANLERYRWLPRTLPDRYILVNVPEFKLVAFDSGQKALEMRVIVGQEYEDKATPVFSDSMEFVVFRPYWLVTPDIAAKEIFPKAAADPNYLAANNMEVYEDHGHRAVRQRPGPKNSLGLVKFMFPNDYNIYLHDTPEHQLFSKDVRAFSHGCIRVEKPAELASWVLGWPVDKVQSAMQDGPDNHQVNLPSKIPVYIVYFTTYVDDGELHFASDLYDRDNKLVSELEDITTLTPATEQAQGTLRRLAGK
jgi:murein L,D-transpeptidase YcbB/YkuD